MCQDDEREETKIKKKMKKKKKTRQVSVIWHLMYFFILLIIDKKAKDDLHPLIKIRKARRYHLTNFFSLYYYKYDFFSVTTRWFGNDINLEKTAKQIFVGVCSEFDTFSSIHRIRILQKYFDYLNGNRFAKLHTYLIPRQYG